MKTLLLSPPVFGFVVATRVALAFGIGLLVSLLRLSKLPCKTSDVEQFVGQAGETLTSRF